ncbi:HECT-domain-containing protein [Eremomyces bilateralis CBS 781.70]|uniref:HECT-type E3 ubiquitin transferase n=1 Tax=Eremomyces bilateralis CBS 781.70 TaxID=1392243 RepID=A0A6G1G6Z8_9PEZI|nr:HECT-domain-containing protein [Eremomyces bilateralis CBS 781.70]KAF1813847.1 HECT-domain-containing protein [Eremomyces bilateralis CBS 781.70]
MPKRQHARSLSHPFPNIFGRRKSAANVEADGAVDSTDDEFVHQDVDSSPNGSPLKRIPTTKRAEDKDIEIGRCMTCDSKVKWPKGLKVFRCMSCLMVNDLEPMSQQRRGERQVRSEGQEHPGTYPGAGQPQRVYPLSVERTRAIIHRCIEIYLHSRKNMENGQAGTPRLRPMPGPPNLPEGGEHTPSPGGDLRESPGPITADQNGMEDNPIDEALGKHLEIRQRGHRGSEATLRPTTLSSSAPEKAPPPPNRRPPPPPISPHPASVDPPIPSPKLPSPRLTQAEMEERRRFDRVRGIFRPLEDYIISSFGNWECLNSSFALGRPKTGHRTRSEGSAQISTPRSRDERPNQALGFPGVAPELDAKTLLLGDVAENGLWWTGRLERNVSHEGYSRQEPHVEPSRSLVTNRSPMMHWFEVNQWYNSVFCAGQSWREVAKTVMPGTLPAEDTPDYGTAVEEIEQDLEDARIHTQRVLLKVAENLLKRPGRPLREPNDIRFLLILLANPILHGSTARRYVRRKSMADALQLPKPRRPSRTLHPNVDRPYLQSTPHQPSPSRGRARTNEPGNHSGIIKRILGLLSTLPPECHRVLVSWFSKYEERHFTTTVDIVASFVTYRLSRQDQRKRSNSQNQDPTAGLIPSLGIGSSTSAQLHAAIGLSNNSGFGSGVGASGSGSRRANGRKSEVFPGARVPVYADDWQLKAASKVMALLFAANSIYYSRRLPPPPDVDGAGDLSAATVRHRARNHGQLLPTSDFYNTLLDYSGDLIADFEAWESRRATFTFCQYPFFLSIGAKIRILEYDARRQMENKAREAFFDGLLKNRVVEQYFHLRVRRDCLVEDSLTRISESVGGSGVEEVKKGLRVQFAGEEGIDAGGLRKEWFLLLVRELFDPNHGMFLYDSESNYCYFNPFSFEQSDQYHLVGAVLGLAIYNSTILDVALPPFCFRKLLANAPSSSHPSASSQSRDAHNVPAQPHTQPPFVPTLDDLSELHPTLARSLRSLLTYTGDLTDLTLDFTASLDRYGSPFPFELAPNGANTPVTNDNVGAYVDAYVRYVLDGAVARQFEPFKRGFWTVCAGNATSLFRAEEVELLVRGADAEQGVDVASLQAVAVYEGWKLPNGTTATDPAEQIPVVKWFWEVFRVANAADQRRILGFITGSDRVPAVGAASLVIRVTCAGVGPGVEERFPIARTCFNQVMLWGYSTRRRLVEKLWRAVTESGGFGLK